MSEEILRLGTRRSALALAQTNTVIRRVQEASPGLNCEIVEVVTSGDKKQKDVHAARDKKEWIVELEHELLSGSIDAAVHSAKDVPIDIEPGTSLCSVLQRESPFDAYVLAPDIKKGEQGAQTPLSFLPKGACVGTASARRKAQLNSLRPDLRVLPVRGNVPTRLQKLKDSEELDALVLANAGLNRLGLESERSGVFSPDELLPAVNQGILAVQFRTSDTKVQNYFSSLVDAGTELAFLAERRLIERLGADCRSCVGVFAEIDSSEQVQFFATVFSPNGERTLEASRGCSLNEWHSANEGEGVVDSVADDLLARGARELLGHS